MRIISFIDQPEVIKKILQHLGLWEEEGGSEGGSGVIFAIFNHRDYFINHVTGVRPESGFCGAPRARRNWRLA
ncbi:MAG: hypothetical protein Q8S00_08390 [Deltaproteobacteria bacterium]|nr:hypothetical protein [Deltaproteobacteria bacterium]